MIVAHGKYRVKLTPSFDICVRELNGCETETIATRKCKSKKRKFPNKPLFIEVPMI